MLTDWLARTFVSGYERVTEPAVRERYGTLSGVVGILLNLLLTAGKLTAGWLSGSIAMTADALNNLTDAASSVVTLVGFRLAGKKADKEHPFGHGRAEYVSGLIVALLTLLVGVSLGRTSLEKILRPQPVAFSWAAAGVLGASVLVKLWMWRFNRRLGRRIASEALGATAVDSLADSVATGVVLAGALLGRYTGLALDGWLGLAVSLFILRSGVQAAGGTWDLLMGHPPGEELLREVEAAVLESPEIVGIHDLAVHDYGPGHLFATIHAEMPADMDLVTAHAAADRVEQVLLERYGVQAVVHVDPVTEPAKGNTGGDGEKEP